MSLDGQGGDEGWEDAEIPEPDAVKRRLEELMLPPIELLHTALRAGQAAGDFCTEAHPVYYRGSRIHGETNGELRLQLAFRGWTFDDDNNIPRAVSPSRHVVITAVAGDAQTGLRSGRDVQTKRPRGAAGLRLVRRNTQLVMLELLPENDPEIVDATSDGTGPMWYLLYYRDGDTVRSELSLAAGVTDEGALLRWRERLILPEIDMLSGPSGDDRRDDDQGPDVDVPVGRRAS